MFSYFVGQQAILCIWCPSVTQNNTPCCNESSNDVVDF